jgi:CheY-like chemotaxis protein
VWVYSEPGLGTSVKIYLPLPRTPGSAPVLPTPAPIVSLRGTETILLVEDEDGVRAVARQVLQRHGYAVIEVARPEDALALADTSQAVDLLLTDIVMPGVGGRALAAQFAARRPGTRVLFMSGYPAAAIGRHQMLERGLAVSAKAVQRRGAGAQGPGGAGVEAAAVGGAAGSGREPTILSPFLITERRRGHGSLPASRPVLPQG